MILDSIEATFYASTKMHAIYCQAANKLVLVLQV